MKALQNLYTENNKNNNKIKEYSSKWKAIARSLFKEPILQRTQFYSCCSLDTMKS